MKHEPVELSGSLAEMRYPLPSPPGSIMRHHWSVLSGESSRARKQISELGWMLEKTTWKDLRFSLFLDAGNSTATSETVITDIYAVRLVPVWPCWLYPSSHSTLLRAEPGANKPANAPAAADPIAKNISGISMPALGSKCLSERRIWEPGPKKRLQVCISTCRCLADSCVFPLLPPLARQSVFRLRWYFWIWCIFNRLFSTSADSITVFHGIASIFTRILYDISFRQKTRNLRLSYWITWEFCQEEPKNSVLMSCTTRHSLIPAYVSLLWIICIDINEHRMIRYFRSIQ